MTGWEWVSPKEPVKVFYGTKSQFYLLSMLRSCMPNQESASQVKSIMLLTYYSPQSPSDYEGSATLARKL